MQVPQPGTSALDSEVSKKKKKKKKTIALELYLCLVWFLERFSIP